jgi:hypothetical protein
MGNFIARNKLNVAFKEGVCFLNTGEDKREQQTILWSAVY